MFDEKILDIFSNNIKVTLNENTPQVEIFGKLSVIGGAKSTSEVLQMLTLKSTSVVSLALRDIHGRIWRGVVLPLLDTVGRLGSEGLLKHTV